MGKATRMILLFFEVFLDVGHFIFLFIFYFFKFYFIFKFYIIVLVLPNKVFTEYGYILLLFHGWGEGEFVLFFGCEACGILPPQTGIKPTPWALPLEGEVLIIKQPGRSQDEPLWKPG